MPPANTPSDTPALSPHRRSDTLPGFDVRSLPAAAAAATSYTQRYTHDDIARGSQSSAGPFRSPRSYDHSRATRLRRTPRDATVVIAERRVLRDQAYGSRIPQVRPGQRQSVYDWAPVPPAGEDDLAPESRALPQPFGFSHLDDDDIRFTASPGSMASPMELGAMMSRHARYSDLGREPGHGVPASTTAGESTFRMAVMQSLRNNAPHQHRSSRTATHSDTTTWGGSEREHLRERREETGNSSSRSRLDPAFSSSPLRYSRHRNGLRSHPCLPSASRGVARVINYLSKIRDCPAPEDSMRMAIKTGFYTREEWIEILDDQNRSDDVILDTLFLRTPETSWLKPGGVFWGSQVAPPNLSSSARSSISHSGEGDSIGDTGASNTNQWSVKVCISSIDYDQLRLTGTMEAFTDGQKHTTASSIVTYLEGELLDFNTHTFKTINFSSSPTCDASNWRKLEPFVHMTNQQMVASLASRKFMKDLMDNWVFMRWKEKCFISPDPDVSGLTIGGFYFLSLRRDDGKIQGYYYDPQSQPYQELSLVPLRRLFPTYEFR